MHSLSLTLAVLAQAPVVDPPPSTVEWLVPIASFVFLLGAVAMILVAWVRVARERQLTIRLALEKGVPMASLVLPPQPGADRRRGILLVAFGVGLAAIVGLTSEAIYASVGALPLAVGVGYLITHLMVKREKPAAATLTA